MYLQELLEKTSHLPEKTPILMSNNYGKYTKAETSHNVIHYTGTTLELEICWDNRYTLRLGDLKLYSYNLNYEITSVDENDGNIINFSGFLLDKSCIILYSKWL